MTTPSAFPTARSGTAPSTSTQTTSSTSRSSARALFERILTSRSGTVLSTHEFDDTWSFIRHADGKVHLDIPELLDELRDLGSATTPESEEFPLVLIAGERRSYNANTIFRDPDWRKSDREGVLRVHPDDAAHLGLTNGAAATCASPRGEVQVHVKLDDGIRRGVVTLPHGYGLTYGNGNGARETHGPNVNHLTWAEHRDPITATPYHKYVPVRISPH